MPIPYPIAVSTVARNFSDLRVIGVEIPRLRKKVAEESYIKEYMSIELPEMIEEIDENFRRKLFASWVKNDKVFSKLKETYKTLDTYQLPENINLQFINPTLLAQVNSTIGDNLITLNFNKTLVPTVLPQTVRSALFQGWQEKGEDVIRLLTLFGKFIIH